MGQTARSKPHVEQKGRINLEIGSIEKMRGTESCGQFVNRFYLVAFAIGAALSFAAGAGHTYILIPGDIFIITLVLPFITYGVLTFYTPVVNHTPVNDWVADLLKAVAAFVVGFPAETLGEIYGMFSLDYKRIIVEVVVLLAMTAVLVVAGINLGTKKKAADKSGGDEE